MGKINRLPRDVYDKIAAGEVVERPASVIKELVENSIDAGADMITVEIQNGGTVYMRVADNGSGMSREDAELSFIRHATSKISTADDLESISTMGFRGEALASISAVAQVDLFTRQQGAESGTHVICVGGEIRNVEEAGVPEGTSFIVKNLFYNVPARMKFLKKDATEAAYIANIMTRFILAHPEISFKFINNGKEQLFSAGDNLLVNSIYSVYGKNYAKASIEFDETFDGIRVFGVAGKGETSRPNRDYQSCFINGRYVKSAIVFSAIEKAYKNQVMVGKFPMAVVNIEINPAEIDINIHPTKLDVKFSDEQTVFRAVYRSIQNALFETLNIPKIEYEDKDDEIFIKPTVPSLFEEKKPKAPAFAPKPAAESLNEELVSLERPRRKADGISYNTDASPEYFQRRQAEIAGAGAIFKMPEGKKQIEMQIPEVAEKPHQQEITEEAPPKNAHVIGQLFGTYIMAEADGELLIIDQHAAHERLMYEKLKEDIAANKVASQGMLVPVVVNLNPVEYAAYREFAAEISAMGFETEDFGNNAILIRSTPYDLDSGELESLMIEIITGFYDKKGGVMSDKRDRLLYTIACKAAVKANHNLQPSEQENLVKRVLDFNNINTCPHGRPITIAMTKRELEKLFKRIV